MQMQLQKMIVTALLLLLGIGSAVAVQGQQALDSVDAKSAITFTDLDGVEHLLPCKAELRGLVLVFINTDCPIANSYHPTLRRLQEEFADDRFDFAMVHADADLKLEAARKHKNDYAITWPVVLDPGNRLARRVSAKVTPEAIVLDAKGQILYRGRIDDRHQSYGRKRPEPTTQDLQAALKAISQDVPVPMPETKPVGCVIRYAD
jgi:thiol-disulfide isomerase/thioredoxin